MSTGEGENISWGEACELYGGPAGVLDQLSLLMFDPSQPMSRRDALQALGIPNLAHRLKDYGFPPSIGEPPDWNSKINPDPYVDLPSGFGGSRIRD